MLIGDTYPASSTGSSSSYSLASFLGGAPHTLIVTLQAARLTKCDVIIRESLDTYLSRPSPAFNIHKGGLRQRVSLGS